MESRAVFRSGGAGRRRHGNRAVRPAQLPGAAAGNSALAGDRRSLRLPRRRRPARSERPRAGVEHSGRLLRAGDADREGSRQEPRCDRLRVTRLASIRLTAILLSRWRAPARSKARCIPGHVSAAKADTASRTYRWSLSYLVRQRTYPRPQQKAEAYCLPRREGSICQAHTNQLGAIRSPSVTEF